MKSNGSRQALKNAVLVALVISSMFFLLMFALFLMKVSTTTSSYTAGGVTAPLQFFYNALHDRLFQTSFYAHGAAKDAGILINPLAHLHYHAIHTYFSTVVYAPIWGIWPNVYWLYILSILVNFTALALFAIYTIRRQQSGPYRIKIAFALAMLLGSGYLFTFQQNGQLLLFGGPFLVAAVYFFNTRHLLLFLFFLICWSLVSEDATMVGFTFCIYIALFEKNAKKYAAFGLLITAVWLILSLFAIQPAARDYVQTADSNTAVAVGKHVLSFSLSSLLTRFTDFAPIIIFILAFGLNRLLFGKSDWSWYRVLGLAIIAPAPHLAQSLVVGAGHHLAPAIIFQYITFVLMLASTSDHIREDMTRLTQKLILCFVVFLIYMMGSTRVLISNIPDPILVKIYSYVGKLDLAKKINLTKEERIKNIELINVVREIPAKNSLVYLANYSVEGFIANRSDIWAFPERYDVADYLIIERNGQQASYSITSTTGNVGANQYSNHKVSSSGDQIISEQLVQQIINELVVDRQIYKVVRNEPHVVLLERMQKMPIVSDPRTKNLGWLNQIFK
jgi:hypothetical protein